MYSELENMGNTLEVIVPSSYDIAELESAVRSAEGIISVMKDRLKEVEQEYKDQMKRILIDHGPFQLGAFKYVLATKKTARQAKPIEILNALSDATGGDFEKIVGCLKSSAFKPGESKRIFNEAATDPDEFQIDVQSLFWDEESDDVKRTELKKINTTFLK